MFKKLFQKYRIARIGRMYQIEERNLSTRLKWVKHGGSSFFTNEKKCAAKIAQMSNQLIIGRVVHKYQKRVVK